MKKVSLQRGLMDSLDRYGKRASGATFSKVYVRGGRFAAYNRATDEFERQGAKARRTGFDWLLFEIMLRDMPRISSYRADIERAVSGKRVLEVGTGPTAVFTRACLDSGAANVYAVEGDVWVAAAAHKVLSRCDQFSGRWKVISSMSTDIDESMLDDDLHFDVLVCELYDSIANQEHVIETIADLTERGITFDSVISRGFETWVCPSAAPPLEKMTGLERRAMGWPSSRTESKLKALEARSTLHGDPSLIASLRLSEPQVWQWANFENQSFETNAQLEFEISEYRRYAGFQFYNRMLFHDGQELDTAKTPTHWGVYFVPLVLPTGASVVEDRHVGLHTHLPDPATPSVFSVQASSAGGLSPAQWF